MSATGLVAAVPAAASWDPSILWYGLYLAGALLIGAVVVEMFRRYRRAEHRSERLSPSDQLAQYRSLYEQGAISEEEFNSLRDLLGGELRASARKSGPSVAKFADWPVSAANPGPNQALPKPQQPGPSTDITTPNSEPPTPSPPENGIKPA
jgi:hypothetical protein